jgi:tetratricopeptide (TPR) repeat protein
VALITIVVRSPRGVTQSSSPLEVESVDVASVYNLACYLSEAVMRCHGRVLLMLALSTSIQGVFHSPCLADYPMRYEEIAAKLQSLYMLDQQIKLEPKEPLLYVQRAAVYQGRKKFPEAIADYTKAIEMKYKSDSEVGDKGQVVYQMRAVCFMQAKNLDAAIADLTKAIAIEPNDAPAIANRGAAYLEKKQYAQAMADYSRALQVDPKLSLAYEGIGETCYKTGQHARAIEYLTRALSSDPKFAQAYFYRGSAYKALGKSGESEKDLKKAASLGYQPGQTLYSSK